MRRRLTRGTLAQELVLVVAAIIAHLAVSFVTMMAVPATSNASAKVSTTGMPLRVRSDIVLPAARPADHARHGTASKVSRPSPKAASGTAKLSRPSPNRSVR